MTNSPRSDEFIRLEEASDAEKRPARSRVGSRGVAVALGLASVLLIAVSVFSLVSGGFFDGGKATPAAVMNAVQNEVATAVAENASNESTGQQASAASESRSSATSDDSGKTSEPSPSNPDKQSSDPTPAPTPNPAPAPKPEPEPAPAPVPDNTIRVSVSVSSASVGNPVSGHASVTLDRGASVYDALCAVGVSVNARPSAYGMYVSAIGGLAEKEHGATSGWVYYVNGSFADRACSAWTLSDGDSVSWEYVTG